MDEGVQCHGRDSTGVQKKEQSLAGDPGEKMRFERAEAVTRLQGRGVSKAGSSGWA